MADKRAKQFQRIIEADQAHDAAIVNGAPPAVIKQLEREVYIAMGPDIPAVIAQTITDKAAIYHGDAVQVLAGIPDESIHYSIFGSVRVSHTTT